MAEQESFSLLKFLGSFFQFLPWVKTLRYAAGFALLGFIGITVYRAFFMPTQTTKQETHIIAQPGAQVTIDQKREEKKSGLEVHPFVEGYGFAESDDRKGVGAKAGVRVDF
jgi:putative Mn2+ efflux pump MntP